MSYKKIVGIILLGLICLVFVFLGAPTQQLGIGAAATVNNDLISMGDYQRELQKMEKRYSSLFGGDLDSTRGFLRSAALENLISQQVIFQGGKEQGLKTTDKEVQSYIVKDIPSFRENGHFRKSFYKRYLDYTQMSPGKFEDLIRGDISSSRMRRVFQIVMAPTREEIQKEIRLKSQTVNLEFVKFDKVTLEKKAQVSANKVMENLKSPDFKKNVADYYKNNSDKFKGDLESEEKNIARKLLQQRMVDEWLSKIQKLVSEGKKDEAEKSVKKWGLKWQETGNFDLGSQSIPKVGEDMAAIKGVFSLSQGQMWNKISVQSGGVRYILKLKAKGENKEVLTSQGRKSLHDQLAQDFSNEFFKQWVDITKAGFKIERNKRLMTR